MGNGFISLHEDEGMEVNYLHTINNEIKILIPDRIFIEDEHLDGLLTIKLCLIIN